MVYSEYFTILFKQEINLVGSAETPSLKLNNQAILI